MSDSIRTDFWNIILACHYKAEKSIYKLSYNIYYHLHLILFQNKKYIFYLYMIPDSMHEILVFLHFWQAGVSLVFSLFSTFDVLDVLVALGLFAGATLDVFSTGTGSGKLISWITLALAWPELNVVLAWVFI